jgi:hypothetical protein
MTSQIIFPKEPTYWILSDGASYYDGLTPSNCVTTVGAGTTVYWIGTNHQEYVQACLDLGITPRNPSDNPLVTINPESPASFLDQKINELKDSINSTIIDIGKSQEESVIKIENDISALSAQQQETVAKLDPIVTNIPNERISATQARLWLINNNIDLALVYSIIDNIPDEQSKKMVLAQWEYSPYIERSHPWLQPLADILQIDLDVVFREAINL